MSMSLSAKQQVVENIVTKAFDQVGSSPDLSEDIIGPIITPLDWI